MLDTTPRNLRFGNIDDGCLCDIEFGRIYGCAIAFGNTAVHAEGKNELIAAGSLRRKCTDEFVIIGVILEIVCRGKGVLVGIIGCAIADITEQSFADAFGGSTAIRFRLAAVTTYDSLGIDWKIDAEKALLSEKDTKHVLLKDFDSPFDINVDLYPEFK